ncbi:MAG: SpoIIE family protein phosphatase [Deltaproteobacteria bacterium]|nr:SpoIIE family protein phosphatase [Deltaproteobacteria bacterium]MBT4641710.1 SpoIIE family protein phosphatase [Deltaproteobacteria bacterium]MBT6612131.1 SpoIIE family protein phosphatase [Deltaproteobacteria bacterium]MBT7151035.1 SpoIIE family protein phosphatase [Deltaproteobacteria bacterium]MBT7713677.1 SpoIIE family protein phosphatase [Deltaproteobacteria bacterium]
MSKKNSNRENTDLDMLQVFHDQEMRVEHSINIIRGIFFATITVANFLFFGIYQGMLLGAFHEMPSINIPMIMMGIGGLFFTLGYLWFVHIFSRPGRYHPWLKYLTIFLDFMFVFRLAILGSQRLTALALEVGGLDNTILVEFMAMFTDGMVVFILIPVLYNFLSALRHGRRIILFSTVLAVISNTLMVVQADLGEFAISSTVVLTILSGLLTVAISIRFNSMFVRLQKAAQKLKDNNISLEQKVVERTKELSHKNELLNETLDHLEESNKKVIDSIEYAKRIQYSLLPHEHDIEKFPFNHFIIWHPRDIVGGDIYHVDFFESGFIVAVFDCTGHGVPGAFITMIALSALKRITTDEGCLNPADILSRLSSIIKTSLHQDTDHVTSNDGLDASVCFVNTVEKTLTYAGSKLPLTYLKDDTVVTIKGDRQSIGYKKSDLNFKFTNHKVDIAEDMAFYLYTDGVIDQLGGDKYFSFGKKRFNNLLLENSGKPLEEQKEKIVQVFQEYKGDHETLDDVTVIGFKV